MIMLAQHPLSRPTGVTIMTKETAQSAISGAPLHACGQRPAVVSRQHF